MTTTLPHPPFAAELEEALAAIGAMAPHAMTADMIPAMRAGNSVDAAREQLVAQGLSVRDVTIPGFQGVDLIASVISGPNHQGIGPGIYHVHGGGMIAGTRLDGLMPLVPWVLDHDAVLFTVEYRLAPEAPSPTPVEDSYAGLVWMAEHAAELRVDADRIFIAGASAGGGLSAGTALLARDRKGPKLIGQMLMCPMIDDRNETVSSRQIDRVGVWDRGTNIMAWTALLGDQRGRDDVSIYSAPARATGLGGLPPAYIDCGSSEVFRDEAVAYASKIWAAGGQAELHVWPGGFHGFDLFGFPSELGRISTQTRDAWVARLLAD